MNWGHMTAILAQVMEITDETFILIDVYIKNGQI